MIYSENEISGELSDFVKCFWMFDSQEEDVVNTILPDGYFDLIFEIRNNELFSVFLTGTWTKAIDVHLEKHYRMFGVRFRLIAAEYIFRESIQTIVDTSTNLPVDYWGALPFDDLAQFEELISRILIRFLPEKNEIDSRKFKLFQILYEQKGDIPVSELADRIGWSSRQINRWFNSQFGLSLKTFANILKCHAAYRQIAKGQLQPAKSYYDQAHFIKEVKRYTGVTPKKLHENQNDRFLQLSTLPKK
jgi:AraC-like DNA-binding protein